LNQVDFGSVEEICVPKIAFICLLYVLAGHVHAQTERYVTDSLRLEARQGPSTNHRITNMLSSGTRVTVLEEDAETGYSRVALDDGSEVWILSRFLMDQPAARAQLAQAREKFTSERDNARNLTGELETMGRTADELEQSKSALATDKKLLQTELAQIKQAAADTLAIQERNQNLDKQLEVVSTDLDAAKQRNRALKERAERDWFIAGAGVLLGGIIIGLVIPKIRWKRRRGWGEL
jgi:SH3 domain protein